MQFDVGKIIKDDSILGEIIALDGKKYIYLNSDLKEKCIEGDIVVFRPEEVFNQNRAFFIRKIETVLKNDNYKKELLKKINRKI